MSPAQLESAREHVRKTGCKLACKQGTFVFDQSSIFCSSCRNVKWSFARSRFNQRELICLTDSLNETPYEAPTFLERLEKLSGVKL